MKPDQILDPKTSSGVSGRFSWALALWRRMGSTERVKKEPEESQKTWKARHLFPDCSNFEQTLMDILKDCGNALNAEHRRSATTVCLISKSTRASSDIHPLLLDRLTVHLSVPSMADHPALFDVLSDLTTACQDHQVRGSWGRLFVVEEALFGNKRARLMFNTEQ